VGTKAKLATIGVVSELEKSLIESERLVIFWDTWGLVNFSQAFEERPGVAPLVRSYGCVPTC